MTPPVRVCVWTHQKKHPTYHLIPLQHVFHSATTGEEKVSHICPMYKKDWIVIK